MSAYLTVETFRSTSLVVSIDTMVVSLRDLLLA